MHLFSIFYNKWKNKKVYQAWIFCLDSIVVSGVYFKMSKLLFFPRAPGRWCHVILIVLKTKQRPRGQKPPTKWPVYTCTCIRSARAALMLLCLITCENTITTRAHTCLLMSMYTVTIIEMVATDTIWRKIKVKLMCKISLYFYLKNVLP